MNSGSREAPGNVTFTSERTSATYWYRKCIEDDIVGADILRLPRPSLCTNGYKRMQSVCIGHANSQRPGARNRAHQSCAFLRREKLINNRTGLFGRHIGHKKVSVLHRELPIYCGNRPQ